MKVTAPAHVGTRAARALLVTGALAFGGPSTMAAQDVEVAARASGLPVPLAYLERVRRDPTAYTLPNGLFRATAIGRAPHRTHGQVRLPIVLALFADSDEPHITREMVQASLFDGPSPRGTVTEAYLEMSRGELDVGGDVFDWVRTDMLLDSVVGHSQGLGDDAQVGAYFIDALEQLDDSVDFSLYDNDGPDGLPDSGDDDGIVDAIAFEFLEVAASCGGPGIWPHRWSLAAWTEDGKPYATDDLVSGDTTRIAVDAYITQSVADCTGDAVQGANVMAHEFGHVLGLPDYYHSVDGSGGANSRRWILGCWSLMAAGSWGCGPVEDERAPFGPTHMDAHSKHTLGWLDYIEVAPEPASHLTFALDPVQAPGAKALRIAMDGRGEEFLIVEYRTRTGFDEDLPSDGVLIYHYDAAASLRPDAAEGEAYRLRLLERDANDGLVRNRAEGGNRGEAGDAWGTAGEDGLPVLPDGPPLLDSRNTSPGTRLNDGRPSPVVVHSVVVQGGRAHIDLSFQIVVDRERAIEFFMVPDGEPLTDLEVHRLDDEGNANGRFDVGDLRRWLRTPEAAGHRAAGVAARRAEP